MEMKARRRRMSAMAATYTAAVLVALAALAILSARRAPRFDVTEKRRHSLSPGTLAILKAMPEGSEPVDILALTSPLVAGGNPREAEAQVAPLMQVFARSSPRVRASVRLAEQEPALVTNLGIDRLPIVLLSWQPPPAADGTRPERRERRTFVVTEEGIATALRDLVEDRKRVAYFLVGHGELRIGDGSASGAALAAATLHGLNFDVRELALAGQGDVPEDADLLVIAGAQDEILLPEVDAIDRWADAGGRLLVLDGPTRDPTQLTALHAWMALEWNLEPGPGVVADFDVPLGADPRILLLMPRSEDHPMLAGLERVVQLPMTRSILFLDRPIEGLAVGAFLRSGPRSWLETDLAQSPPRYDEGADTRGPLALAWAGARTLPGTGVESRMVVFGTRMAFANQYLQGGGNMALLRNAADWVTGRESDILARVGSASDGTVIVAERQARIILVSMLLLPVIVSLTGVATWWRRRRL